MFEIPVPISFTNIVTNGTYDLVFTEVKDFALIPSFTNFSFSFAGKLATVVSTSSDVPNRTFTMRVTLTSADNSNSTADFTTALLGIAGLASSNMKLTGVKLVVNNSPIVYILIFVAILVVLGLIKIFKK